MTTPALRVTDLAVTYGGVRAVDDVAFAVTAGTIHGLIGPNGAGKTTCIDAISGFVPHAHGRVELDGMRIDELPAHRRARAGLARTFQSAELFDDLCVRDNLVVAAAHRRWWSPLRDAVLPGRGRREVDVEHWLELAGIADLADVMPHELSNGQTRLVGLARALVTRPRVVLLDEPAAGLDPAETAALGALLRRVRDDGTSVVLVDHDMTLVLDVCDRITVIDFGRVIADDTPAVIGDHPAVVAAYLGGAP